MNKEQIIDEAYENYEKNVIKSHKENGLEGFNYLTKDSFIERIETDPEFSQKWGLKIYTKVDGDKVWMGMVYNDNAVEIRLK